MKMRAWSKGVKLRSRKGILLIAIAAVLVLGAVVGGVAYQNATNKPAQPKANLSSSIDTDISNTETEDIDTVLEYKYDIKLADLRESNLRGELKNFESAYDVALAFFRMNNYSMSVASYKVAYDKRDKNENNALFFVDYCSAAFAKSDVALTERICKEAEKEINDSDMSETAKEDRVHGVRQAIRYVGETK